MFEKFKPLGDRVLIQRLEAHEEMTASGIIIPDSAKEKAQTGKVLAVGAGHRTAEGVVTPLSVKVGDTVFFGKYSGTEAGPDMLIAREDEILGIIEK